MKINMDICKISSDRYEFKVIFHNDADVGIVLPIQKLRSSAARVGLHISSSKGVLDAIEFKIISHAAKPIEMGLEPGNAYVMVLLAELKKIGKASWGLIFDEATYIVEPNLYYDVKFSLGVYRSETVKWSFSDKNLF